jgi:TatD family hydrolase
VISAAFPRILSALTCHASRGWYRPTTSPLAASSSLQLLSYLREEPNAVAAKRRRPGALLLQAAGHRHSRRSSQSFWSYEEAPAASRLASHPRRPHSRMASFASWSPGGIADEDSIRLIDVDCNLWHKDLRPLIWSTTSPSSTANVNGTQRDGDNGDDKDANDLSNDPFAIVDNDDMSHCAALLSPSSTVLEAQRGLQSLLQRQRQHERSAGADFEGCASTASEETATTMGMSIPIRTTVGIHPYHVKDGDCGDVEASRGQLVELLSNSMHAPYVAAVGECGLDTSPGFPPLSDQVPFFRMQIELACEHNLPLFVHERLAFETCCQLLDEAKTIVPVIVHCFTGSRDECVEYVRRGYYLSISGYIFKDETLAEILEEGIIPLDRLMVETDAPYMGFAGCRTRYVAKHSAAAETVLNSKQRKKLSNSVYPNVPSSLHMVFDKVREHVNMGRVRRHEPELTRTELAQRTTKTANRFFGFGLSSPRGSDVQSDRYETIS